MEGGADISGYAERNQNRKTQLLDLVSENFASVEDACPKDVIKLLLMGEEYSELKKLYGTEEFIQYDGYDRWLSYLKEKVRLDLSILRALEGNYEEDMYGRCFSEHVVDRYADMDYKSKAHVRKLESHLHFCKDCFKEVLKQEALNDFFDEGLRQIGLLLQEDGSEEHVDNYLRRIFGNPQLDEEDGKEILERIRKKIWGQMKFMDFVDSDEFVEMLRKFSKKHKRGES